MITRKDTILFSLLVAFFPLPFILIDSTLAYPKPTCIAVSLGCGLFFYVILEIVGLICLAIERWKECQIETIEDERTE